MATYTASNNIYDAFVSKLGLLAISATPDLRIALTTSSHTPSQSTHDFADDLTNELSGNGYSRSTPSNPVFATTAGGNGQFMFDSDNPTFTASGGSLVARYWHLILWQTADSDSPLIAYGLLDDNDLDVTTTDGNTLTLTLSSTGYVTQSRT